MNRFDYRACGSIDEVTSALRTEGAQVIAGGTDLLIGLRRPDSRMPRLLVDITRVRELRGITERDGVIALGAAVTHAELSRSPLLKRAAPFLPTACSCVGSPQIRNRGTVGGNIMNAAACADSVPPLIALDARVTLASSGAARTLPLSDLFEAPYRTCARNDEVLTTIEFVPLPDGTGSAFLKLGRRNALSIARLSVAAVLTLNGEGAIRDARIVPGAAVPVWHRFTAAEQLLIGRAPAAELFVEAGRSAAAEMVATTGRRWSTEYKEPVIAVLVRRALETALACASRSERTTVIS